MLNKIIEFSLRNRLAIIILAIITVVGGCWCASKMEVDVFPDLNAPTVVVMTEAPGMAAEEVEQTVTLPVETALNGAAGVRRVRSSSTTGFSSVWVEFDWDTEVYHARQTVSERLASMSGTLPQGAGEPTLGAQSSILGEVLFIGLTADTTSMRNLRTLADKQLTPALLAVEGVSQVNVLGGEVKEYQILLSPTKMSALGVTLADVAQATEGMTRNATGGITYDYGNEFIIRGLVSTTDTAVIEQAVVSKTLAGSPIMLRDIADIKVGNASPLTGAASVNGKPAVLMTVTKQPGVGTIELTERLENTLESLKKTIPYDVKVSTDLYRQRDFIDSSIDNIKRSLLEGAIFVALILFIFLMNPRTTLISLVTIPIALLVTLITMRLMDLSINTMSLGGLAIAIGSLVDDAIVDVENVYKRLRENFKLPKEQRQKITKIVFEASREVRMPILNSTLIIVVSFVPLFFLQGMEGRMLMPLGIAFITALFASTLVALTLTPVLCSLLLPQKVVKAHEPRLVRWLKGGYVFLLQGAIRCKWIVLAITAGALALALYVFSFLGRDFLPPFNEGSFTVNVTTLPGISLEQSDSIGARAERMLLSVPEIKRVARKTGRAELDEHALGINTSEMEAPYELAGRSKEEVSEEIRKKLSVIPGINIEIGQPISHRIDAMLSGTESNIAIKIFGPDLHTLYRLGTETKEAIEKVNGLQDINVEQLIDRPQINITPRPQMMARYGITVPEFTNFINTALSGVSVSEIREGNSVYPLTVKIAPEYRQDIEQIGNLPIDCADGLKVPLRAVADISSTSGPNTVNREDVSRVLVVSANVSERDMRSAVDEIKNKINEKVSLPPDYRISYGGQFESEESASRTLLIASLFSLLAIYLLLYGQFRSALQSAVVMVNLPLALIGGVFAIWFTGGNVSIPAIIGFISLFGIATRNGMLLVDRYNTLCNRGLTLMQAVLEGSADRLNPILMTALTSTLALIPLAIAGSQPGGEIQSPMAKVILGGLLSATLLNAFIIPIMYLLFIKKNTK
ncbi:MAG: efflux RND transporter permease subunit [Prevotella sp.]|nr:efflux RND transporter permease subunit [Prevotella sp.]MCM1074217.1 efflux RND transporter permease subunit [Ruminococcus sp.]